MREYLNFVKYKYIISSVVVVFYILILHETDIFTLIQRNQRVTNLEQEIDRKKEGIEDLKIAIEELEDIRSLEKYARENHYFKREDEDIFIFSFE